MNKLGLRNVILVSLSAAFLNLSFVLAQPAQPPANGALTPNFTGLNVTGTSNIGTLNVTGTSDLSDLNVTGNIEISDTLETNNIRSIDGTLTNFDDNVNMDGDLSVGADISASYLNLRSVSTGLNTVGDIKVGGELKSDFIYTNSNSNITMSNIKLNQISERTSGNGVSVYGALKSNLIKERTTNSGISLDDDTSINGTLSVNTIEEKTSGNGTRFDNYIVVSGAVNAQSFGGASADFGSLNISGTNFLTYLKNRISVVVPDYTESNDTYATCPTGTIAISCGATGRYWSSRLHSVYRSSERSCRALWGAGSQNRTTAVCFDY